MITLYLFLSLLLSLGMYLYIYFQKNKRFYELLWTFPSPPGLPIIGNIHLVLGNGQSRVKKFLQILREYESPFVFWLCNMPVIILTKPEDIQVIGSKCVDRDVMGVFEDSVGDGIIVARAEKWRKTRRMINPAFSPSMLRQYLIVFNEQARILVQKLQKEANTGKIFDLWPYIVNGNIDMITENITGMKICTQENLGNEFSVALTTTLRLESLRLLFPWLLQPKLFYIYRLFTGNKNVFKTLHTLPKQVLQHKQRNYILQKKQTENISSTEEKNPRTVMDILLRVHETNPEFTETQILEEALNIMVTGTESTAVVGKRVTVPSFVFSVKNYVRILFEPTEPAKQKLYEEIDGVSGSNRQFHMDDLIQLKYLEQCIKETLRIFTLFPITLRKTTEEIKLNDNRIIPRNCQIAIVLYGVHRDSTIYPNPKQFNPDNFSQENVEKRSKYSFLAFGVGPRACIGSKYGMITMKTQISHIVYNYLITTDCKMEDIRITMDAVIRSKNGFPVKLALRKLN